MFFLHGPSPGCAQSAEDSVRTDRAQERPDPLLAATPRARSITLPPEMAAEAERLAKEEGRTMSELMREAFRRYRQESALDAANR